MAIGIQNPSPTDKDIESGIHCVESRIQECLGFPYMGVKTSWTIGTNGPSELPVPSQATRENNLSPLNETHFNQKNHWNDIIFYW